MIIINQLVIFPQAPLDDNWSSRVLTDNEVRQVFPENEKPTKSLQLVIKLMDSLLKKILSTIREFI